MYEREKTLLLSHGCGAVCNSMTVRRSGERTWVAWPHHSRVCLLMLEAGSAETRTVAEGGQGSVMQVRWVELKDAVHLVVAATDGVRFYDERGGSLLFSFAYSQEGGGASFTRGIAAFLGRVCVGASDGSVLVFSPDPGCLHLAQRVRQHASAVTALTADGELMVSADNAGNIVQWTGQGGELNKLRQIDHYGSACTGLVLTADFIVAVYGSGHLRLFSRASGQVRAEATAHARWITGLDLAPESGLVVTVAEDAAVKVWRVADDETPLTHKFTEHEPQSRLMGAGFLRADGATFGLAAYDQRQLICYAM